MILNELWQTLDEVGEYYSLPSVERAKQLLPRFLKAAQADYDAWDETNTDVYAGGGICHIIADSICGVLIEYGIDCSPVSCNYEQHVFVAAKFAEGVYTIDIPYWIYEQGGGFSWKKLPDVEFEPRDVVFYKTSSDPEDFEQYINESQANENFADGRRPGRKGLAKRVGVNCKQPVSKLRKIAKASSGEKQRMAHWCANMKSHNENKLSLDNKKSVKNAR